MDRCYDSWWLILHSCRCSLSQNIFFAFSTFLLEPIQRIKCFGGRVIIKMKDGSKIEDQLGIADAHPNGKRPFKRENYINKFKTLTANIIDQKESERFLEDVQNLKEINKSELHKLNVEVVSDLQKQRSSKNSIF